MTLNATSIVALVDGYTNSSTLGAIKAPNTAAVAGDPALVVTISPNQGASGVGTSFSDSGNLDAFGRLRVSEPITIFTHKMILDNQPLIFDDQQISGASTTSVFNTNQASVTISATGNVAGDRVRQSFIRPAYQPGRSQLIFLTGIINATGTAAAGITRRLGQFDGYNGFFFQYGGTPGAGVLSVVRRTNTSGTPVDNIVPSTAWNVDKLDGTGPSGITVDTTKVQIFVIDYQWLGSGRIRFGLDVSGVIHYCHYIFIANVNPTVSVSTPNNPIRYEIISDGTGTSSVATMTHICASVSSEGGQQLLGFPFSVNNSAVSTLTTGANTNQYPLIALQAQSNKLGATIQLQSYTLFSSTANANVLVQFILNPTITGTTLSFTPVSNSTLQFALGTNATTISGGTVIYSEYVNVSKISSVSQMFGTESNLGAFISGVGQIIVITVTSIGGTALVMYGGVSWLELA